MDSDNVLSADTLTNIEQTTGVKDAAGWVETELSKVETASGDELAFDYPQLGLWVDNNPFSNEVIVDGEAPAVGQFTVDSGVADQLDMKISETFTVQAADISDELVLSGLIENRQTDGTTKPVEQFGELVATLWAPEETVYELGQFDSGTYTEILINTVERTPVSEVQLRGPRWLVQGVCGFRFGGL